MLNATIVKRLDITKDLMILQVKPDSGVPDFVPGQYVALALGENGALEGTGKKPRLIRRAYSIGSPPHEKQYLEFYVAVVAGGELTPKIAALGEGDRIFVTPKITGTFTLANVPQGSDLVLISTGTGIAPYMSMLRTPETWVPGRRIRMVHGVRYTSDLAYSDELSTLSEAREDFEYYSIVSRPDSSWQGYKGYVQNLIKDKTIELDPARDHVFLCGNPAMITDMEALLTGIGFREHTKRQPGNMHLEKYW